MPDPSKKPRLRALGMPTVRAGDVTPTPDPLALIAEARMGARTLRDMNTNNPPGPLGATRIRVGSIHDLELFLTQVSDALEATLPEPLPRRTVTLGATTGTATIIYPKENTHD